MRVILRKTVMLLPFGLCFAAMLAVAPMGLASGSGAKKESQPMSKTPSQAKTDPSKAPAVPNQYLISFTKESTSQERDALLGAVGAQMIEKVGSTPLFLIEISKDVDATLEKLRKNPSVRYVEPNFTMSTFGK
jgi:hypothetical protein